VSAFGFFGTLPVEGEKPSGHERAHALLHRGEILGRLSRRSCVAMAISAGLLILELNPVGIPIGQILIPKRNTGHNLGTTSLGYIPGSARLLIVTNACVNQRGYSGLTWPNSSASGRAASAAHQPSASGKNPKCTITLPSRNAARNSPAAPT
jgi:hypothetical protein